MRGGGLSEAEARALVRLILSTLAVYSLRHRRRGGGRNLVGETDYERKEILVWPSRANGFDDLLDTIIHEVLHAALPELGEEEIREAAGAVVRWSLGGRVSGRRLFRLRRVLTRFLMSHEEGVR